MRRGTILFCAVLFLVAGCAELPRPATFPYSTQQQLQSASHWQQIAELTVARLTSDPDLVDILKPDSGGSRPIIYVQTSDGSPFGEAFRGYLITKLRDAHFLLSDTPDGPINLRWSIQLVGRNAERPKQFLGVPATVLEMAWILLFGYWDTTDFMVPQTEVILTTRVTIGKDPIKDSVGNIIKRYSDTFYINDGDWDNYQVAASGNAFSRSIAGQDEAWRQRLRQRGLLSE